MTKKSIKRRLKRARMLAMYRDFVAEYDLRFPNSLLIYAVQRGSLRKFRDAVLSGFWTCPF